MGNCINSFKKGSTKDKISIVVILSLSVVVIILSVLDLLGVLNDTIKIYEPMVGIILLFQAYNMWKTSRSAALISLCTSIFIFGAAVFIIFF